MDKPKPKHKSGAEKRKLKEQNIQKINKLPKIDKYFVFPSMQPQTQHSHDQASVSSSSSLSQGNENVRLEFLDDTNTEQAPCQELELLKCVTGEPIQPSEEMLGPEDLKRLNFSNDLSDYANKELSDDAKRLIISLPPNKPKGPFPKDI